MPSRAKQAIAIAFVISALFGLSPSRAQQSIEEGAGDPSTPLGRSMNQNQQEQQQTQQNIQRDQQNWNQYMHGQQLNQSNQGGYYQAPAENGGVYGAIFVDPANPSISRFSYSFSSPVTARAGPRAPAMARPVTSRAYSRSSTTMRVRRLPTQQQSVGGAGGRIAGSRSGRGRGRLPKGRRPVVYGGPRRLLAKLQ